MLKGKYLNIWMSCGISRTHTCVSIQMSCFKARTRRSWIDCRRFWICFTKSTQFSTCEHMLHDVYEYITRTRLDVYEYHTRMRRLWIYLKHELDVYEYIVICCGKHYELNGSIQLNEIYVCGYSRDRKMSVGMWVCRIVIESTLYYYWEFVILKSPIDSVCDILHHTCEYLDVVWVHHEINELF